MLIQARREYNNIAYDNVSISNCNVQQRHAIYKTMYSNSMYDMFFNMIYKMSQRCVDEAAF